MVAPVNTDKHLSLPMPNQLSNDIGLINEVVVVAPVNTDKHLSLPMPNQ